MAAAAVALLFSMPAASQESEKPTAAPTPVVSVRVRGTPIPRYDNWRDAPVKAGDWSYVGQEEGTSASFVSETVPRFRISCDLASKRVTFTWPGMIAAKGSMMKFRTASLDGELATDTPDRTVFETLSYGEVGHPLLDALPDAGERFAVELGSSPPLYLPGAEEVARVIEDCR